MRRQVGQHLVLFLDRLGLLGGEQVGRGLVSRRLGLAQRRLGAGDALQPLVELVEVLVQLATAAATAPRPALSFRFSALVFCFSSSCRLVSWATSFEQAFDVAARQAAGLVHLFQQGRQAP